MKIPTGSRRFERLLVALIVASCTAAGAARVDAAGDAEGQLKWTPHRAAVAPAGTVADQRIAPVADAGSETVAAPRTAATPPRLQSVPASGVGSVQLPDGVPPVDSLRSKAAAPTATRTRTALPTQARRPAPPPLSPDAVLGVDIFRTPGRTASRPILADESPAPMARQVERLGGGLAPRFDVSPRSARLAANVDALPSVMRQGAGQQPATPADPGTAGSPEPVATPAPRDDGGTAFGDGTMEGLELPGAEESIQMGGPDGLMLGEYPPQLHVESFYDDPYACEDDDPLCHHSGRFCAWFRRFGRPYYGWRWYRDFTAGAGVVAFTNQSDLGFGGNFGVNEYLNQGMPFWNAFGVGWQVGARGTQTNFQNTTTQFPGGTLQRNSREQVFVTTGFFTRAFEGRGLQGGAVYDYQHDNWLDTTDVAQLRYELSYVWGYHEFGFWGASNIGDQDSIFGPVKKTPGVASTLDLYTAFYRLQFGDANEWKVWGGATGYGDGIIGSIVRAPMARSWALEGCFTYVIPGDSRTIDLDGKGTTHTYSAAAWNVGANVVFYPGGRSRRSLASPYRPLFDVADNGTLIRRLSGTTP
jgi:hypothetical protein